MSEFENNIPEIEMDETECSENNRVSDLDINSEYPEIEIEIESLCDNDVEPEIEIQLETEVSDEAVVTAVQPYEEIEKGIVATEDDSACESNEDVADRREKVFHSFYLRMKWEHKTWKIYEKIHLAFAIIFGLVALLYMVLSFVTDDGINIVFGAYTYYYFAFLANYIALCVIDNISKHKLSKYMTGLFCNCAPSVKRATSVRMIIFTFIFNKVALVFYIINFIHAKRNKTVFEQIQRQQIERLSNNSEM